MPLAGAIWTRRHAQAQFVAAEFSMNNAFKALGVADSLYEGLRRCGVPE